MKFQCERERLVEALQTCQRAISTKSLLPILSGVLLKTEAGGLSLSATDLEISIRTTLPIETKEKGSLVVPSRLILDILNSLEEEMVELSLIKEKGQIEVLSGESRFDVNVFFEEDFPKIPETSGPPACVIASDVINPVIREVVKAASRDDAKPILTGVFTEIKGELLRMVATDSYRLAVAESAIEDGTSSDVDAIVPARSLKELNRIISSGSAEKVSIFLTGSQILFQAGEVELVSRLIEGEFPNYEQILPKGYEKKIRANKNRLLGAVRRASLMAQNNSPVRLTTANNLMVVSANTQDVGEATERLDVEYPGEEMKIAFNPQYLMDGLSSVEEDEVVIEVADPLKPALIKPIGEKGFLYLIMPIRLS